MSRGFLWSFLALGFVLALTMGPSPGETLIDVLEGVLARWDIAVRPFAWPIIVAANVALFVPLGVGLAIWLQRWPAVALVLLASAVSVGVELVQWAFLASRQPMAADVAANTAGAGLGIGAVRLWRRVSPAPRLACGTVDNPEE